MNHITLIGRLTKDPELKYSQSGKSFSKFTVAVNRDFNRDEADFINCVAWGKTAETIVEYLSKGKRIALQGRLAINKFERDGETKWTTEVYVDRFEFIESANSGGNSKTSNGRFEDDVIDEDDFPF